MQIQETASFTIKSWQLTVTNGLAKSYSGVRRYAPVKPVAAGSGNGNSGNGDGKPLMALKVYNRALNIQRQELSTLHVTQILRKNQSRPSNLLLFSVRVTMLSMTKFWLRITTNGFLTFGYDYVRYYADIATLTPAKAETPTVKPTETNQAKPETSGAEKLQQVVLIMWHVAWMLKWT